MRAIKVSHYQRLINILLVVIITIGSMSAGLGCNKAQPIEVSMPQPLITQPMSQIYIGGAVMSPGLYPLKAGDSLETLIQAAGGLSGGADSRRLKLYIPWAGEEESPQKIDINRAQAWLLQALPGIGEVRAQDIVNYRSQYGPFSNINELLKVKGIGTTTYENIRDLVTVGE